MPYGKKDILAHVDLIIERQQYELDEISQGRARRLRMDRAKDRISKLRLFRYQLATDSNPDPRMLDLIKRDMRELGW